MENEGIMALSQGLAMQENQGQMPVVPSADAYDAAQTAMQMVSPDDLAALKESLRQNMVQMEFTPSQLDQLIQIFEALAQSPEQYPAVRQSLIEQDLLDPEDLPEEYDPQFIGAILVALNEMRLMAAQGAGSAMMESPPVEGMAPMAMAQGGLADMAAFLAAQGRNGDKMLAHITPEEAQFLRQRGGAGTINPVTGLPEFFLKKVFNSVKSAVKSVVNATKKALQSPVGRILGTIALATVLGPFVGVAMAGGLAGAGTTLLAGGSLKDALVSGALGYIGGGGTIGGFSPLKAVSGALGTGTGLLSTGSAINTGLTMGALGTGAGLLMGQPLRQAARMGAMQGLTAGAVQGLSRGTLQSPEVELTPTGTPASPTAQAATPASSNAPGSNPYYLQPASGAPAPSPTLWDKMTQAPVKLYNEYLSPNRPGLPNDAGMIQRYAPLALAGTAAAYGLGGMEETPANPAPVFNAQYTGREFIRDNPDLFRGGLDASYQRPNLPGGTIVDPSQMYRYYSAQNPSGLPSNMPGPQAPAEVAQPYNMAGLYGIPQLYGSPPVGLAKGGEPRPTNFPRKTGPIDGPGTGTSDSIPAMLSDGEFVFTARAVRNAGGGSRRKGAARMYKLMKKLEGGPVKA